MKYAVVFCPPNSSTRIVLSTHGSLAEAHQVANKAWRKDNAPYRVFEMDGVSGGRFPRKGDRVVIVDYSDRLLVMRSEDWDSLADGKEDFRL